MATETAKEKSGEAKEEPASNSLSISEQSEQIVQSQSDAIASVEAIAARNVSYVRAPPRVRTRRKRVALDLNEWNQLPSYLKDNE